MLGKSLAAILAIILNNLVTLSCLRFQTVVTMLAIVSKLWLLCWILFQNYGYYVGYCFKTLVTMSAIVSKLWLLCWILFQNVGYCVGYCFKTMVSMLAIVSKRWLLCWILFQNYGYYEGHFYVRRIGLYLYKYRIYGTISIYILKGLAFVYQLI